MNKITFAAGILVLASTAAAAQHPVFQWSPEDLTTLERVSETHERIQAAARDICRDRLHGTRSLRLQSQCTGAVVDEIVVGIDDQRLTAYARTGAVDDNLLSAIAPRG